MVVRSLLGALIAAQQSNTPSSGNAPTAQSTNHLSDHVDQRPSRRSIIKSPHQGDDNEETNDRKPAAKRKRHVNFDTDDDNDNDHYHNNTSENENDGEDDDDSLYRGGGFVKEEVGDLDSLADYGTDDAEDPQQQLSSMNFHEHYAKTLHVLCDPPEGPSLETVAPPLEYFQTLQETLARPVPPIMQYPAPIQLLEPRPKRVRNRQTKTWNTVLETPTEAQQRVHRHERFVERLIISHRWKTRVVDFRNEPDVGGAIYHRAKRHLQDKVRQEVSEQRQRDDEAAARQRIEQQVSAANNNDEPSSLLQDEDSVQEQQGVLDRLTQQSADDDETNMNESTTATVASNYTSADEAIAQWSDLSIPYKEHMDYWNYGYACPRNVEYPANKTSLRPQILPATRGEKFSDPDPHGLRLRRRPMLYNKEGQHDWQPSYFPPSRATSDPRFFQYRLLQALVTRHLCGRGTNEILQERLLRLLFAPTHHEGEALAKFSRARTFLILANQLGCNALLYSQHTWSNPEAAARALGLLGNDALAGQTQNPVSLQRFMTILRRHVLRKYRLKKIPWNHHSDKPQKKTNQKDHEPSSLVHEPPHHPSSVDVQRLVGSSPREDLEAMAAGQQSNKDGPPNTSGAHRDLEDAQNELLQEGTMNDESPHAKEIGVNQDEMRHAQATTGQGPSNPLVETRRRDEESTQDNNVEGPHPDSTNSHFLTPVDELDRGTDDSRASDLGEMEGTNSNKAQSMTSANHSTGPPESDKEMTVDGTSQGGVIIDLRTNPSEASSKKSQARFDGPPSKLAIEEARLFPTSKFAHIPGTSPPIPPFPLDPTGIVYGPIDRFARYNHQEFHVHHGHLQLALSTLLARVIQSDHERHRQALHTLLDDYVELTDNRGYKRHFLQSRGKVRDVPLVQFYRALGMYCNFLANGYPTLRRQDQSGFKEDEDDAMETQSYSDEMKRDPLNPREVAEQLFKLLEHRIQHNGLIRFPRLKEIFARATMTRKLPVGAATILSRPLNEHECPLHVVRECIEYLEQNSHIRGGQGTAGYFDADDESIQYGELEYMFYSASEVFEDCINADPMNIDYFAWRVGTLAVSFLLCSGNRIGGTQAVRYSSALKRQTFDGIGNLRGDSYLDHEVREKLPKFEEVALHLTNAIQSLFTLTRYQPGAKAHLTIVSLLEWHQVIALLAGDVLEHHTENIKSLYHHHVVHRHFQEYSASSRAGMNSLSKSVGFYAMELENDPGNIECWRALVNALGPVGKKCDATVDESHRDSCVHCQLVRQGRRIDHESTENLGSKWWGCGRQWWLTSLLHVPKHPKQQRNQSTTEPVLFQLEESLQELTEVHSDILEDPNFSANNASLDWLPTKADLGERRKKIPSNEERAASFHNVLPPYHQDTCGDNKSDICTIAGHVSPKVEILVYKIFILCHLKGPGDPEVYDRIYSLIRESWDYKAECVKLDSDHLQGVLWLYNAGIDVPTMCRRHYPKYCRHPLKKKYVAKKKQ